MTPADELRTAAARLRDLAPQITGPLAGLADPVADWLDAAAQQEAYTLAEFGHRGGAGPHALTIARHINGGQQ